MTDTYEFSIDNIDEEYDNEPIHEYSFSVNYNPSPYLMSELAEPKESVQCYALHCNNLTRYSILSSINDEPQAFLRVCAKHFDHIKAGWTLPLRRIDKYP